MSNNKEDYEKAVEESMAFLQQILMRTAMEQQQGKPLDINVLAEDINKYIGYMQDNYKLDIKEIIKGVDKTMESDIPDKLSALINEQMKKQKGNENGSNNRKDQIHSSDEQTEEKEKIEDE